MTYYLRNVQKSPYIQKASCSIFCFWCFLLPSIKKKNLKGASHCFIFLVSHCYQSVTAASKIHFMLLQWKETALCRTQRLIEQNHTHTHQGSHAMLSTCPGLADARFHKVFHPQRTYRQKEFLREWEDTVGGTVGAHLDGLQRIRFLESLRYLEYSHKRLEEPTNLQGTTLVDEDRKIQFAIK